MSKLTEHSGVQFRFAIDGDVQQIRRLLASVDLPYKDIDKHVLNYLLAEENADLVGVVGLEIANDSGLLRSLAVKTDTRNSGLGTILVDKIISHARLNNINKLFLLTTTASEFFKKRGFSETERELVPQEIKATEEFKSICPSSAVCMSRDIGRDVLFCTKDILRLTEDVPGAKMWAVSLEKTMFTYFKVQPNSIFDAHSHESEQITMVLDGALYFDISGKIYSVLAGDVIAIPSNMRHMVFTRDLSAKAVDACSPVMNRYKNDEQAGQ